MIPNQNRSTFKLDETGQMGQIDTVIDTLKDILRRRKWLLILIPIIMCLLGGTAAYLIPAKYHSSTSILVQKEETLNPLILYEMAVNMASEDRLKSFNKIVFSRTTVEILIDSLNLDRDIKNNVERQKLIEKVKKNINTNFSGSDSFEIIYYDSDPYRAQKGVDIIANHFIKTRLSLENQRNEQTVVFFEDKLEELEKEVEVRRSNILDISRQRLQNTPNDNTSLRIQMQNLDREIAGLEEDINNMERIQNSLNNINISRISPAQIEDLYSLTLMNFPYSGELRSVLREYDTQKQSFTAEHPSIKRLLNQIKDLSSRMPPAVQTEIDLKKLKIQDLTDQRELILANIEETVVAQRMDEGTESDYGIYRKLYDEMKVKLEQAKTTRDLGRKAADQFVVIDPPFFPEKPSSPNRLLIIIGSLFVGLFVAAFTVVVAEVLDNTIRSEVDVMTYNKPIIAFISDGKSY